MFSESLDELTAMVLPLFDKVVNKNVEIPVWNEHPCGSEQVKVGEILHLETTEKKNVIKKDWRIILVKYLSY